MNNKKIRVFLSRPNPFTKEQQYFIAKLKSTLDKYNIESITLQAKDYSPYESLTVLNEMIKRCYGMVILAFGHTYIQSGILKKGAVKNKNFFEAEEQSLDGKWITSSFCQIEGAMAISNNIPILIIKQKDLRIDGILKDDKKIVSVSDFTLENTSQIDFFFE
ncbi:TPA: hypothetical protein VYQ01_002046, partial [Streptococcus pneumoniae]|nr:hypothetical protein [Streptococcus pneumoniae]